MQIKEMVSYKMVVDKSSFIAFVNKYDTVEAFNQELVSIQKKYYDARHIVFAYKIQGFIKYSDDNEPSGTAGLPLLNLLNQKNIDNSAIIVVRYFGGIKLGASNLLRAYKNTANNALENAKYCIKQKVYVFELSLDYSLANKLEYSLLKNINLINKTFDLNVIYTFYLNENNTDIIENLTQGTKPKFIEEKEILVDI